MYLNTKCLKAQIILLLAVFGTLKGVAQIEKPTNNNLTNKEHVMISFGHIQPFPFGENIATKAYAISGGFEHSVWVHTGSDIWVGAKLSLFYGKVEKKALTGNYDKMNIFSIGPMVGYKFHVADKLGLLIGAGLGYVKYRNKLKGYTFYDDGTSLKALSNLDYELTDHFGLYFSGTIRRDFLQTELPIMGEHYFDVNYVVLSLGIRIVF